MKKILSLLLTCTVLYAAAQSPHAVFNYKTAISFNPLVLIGPDYTAMFGAERRLKNNLALVLDAGYVFQSSYFNSSVVKSISGFNLRPGIKLYTKEEKRFYLQLQVFYKQVDYKIYDWLGKSCVNEIPSYEQLEDFTYRKKALSFNVMAGRLFRISDKILLEFYGGAGVKIKNQKPIETAACYRNNDGGIIDIFQEHSITPNLPLGIKLLIAVD
ncbi:MAG: hypothetical protein M3352_04450 [Bacteroidota bacterium]|nr:hypothetical protein [Bacteroidota bacterium]